MASRSRKQAPDQAQRDAAVMERARNVIVDAGAGTGKTTILVGRLVEMLAPTTNEPAIPISRIGAITFTRKAAGELRLRIRERLLEELADVHLGSDRDTQLRDALAGLDTAFVGTIHSFADRLLRLRPVEAELSPSYEVTEDDGLLIRETFEVFLHSIETGTLAAALAGTDASALADEVTSTILSALAVGLQPESRETEWYVYYGLDALIEGFIRQRDIPPPGHPPAPFDFVSFQSAANEFIDLAKPVLRGSPGADWILNTGNILSSLQKSSDPEQVYGELKRQLGRAPRSVTKKYTFAGDEGAWTVWKAYSGNDKRRVGALKEELEAPLNRWMATRLVRLFPAVAAIYEKVKSRRRTLDQLDLLIKLRDLLAQNKQARGEYQDLFDHIFVDEFQDTDPLQAEIVLYLCEREPLANRWGDVVLSDGKLTLVGDPKQSIYRFRRADVAMYDRVRGLVARGPHLEAKLSANFRSAPPLIAWLNNRFERVLGVQPDGSPFDPKTGRVFHQPLLPGRVGEVHPAVHVLGFDFKDGGKHGVDEYRELEGRAVAQYLRWLVERSDIRIVDLFDGRPRRIRYGDIAILAVSTWGLPLLFPSLDAENIPYASRGGTLFLNDPVHRQFLLGLRAIADRDDGVAEAALFRPPFFALDLADLIHQRAATVEGAIQDQESALRAAEARDLVHELRRQRFDRSPGATARDLLEHTAFGRSVAVGPNGAQRLTRLRELCLVLEQLAASEGLDYDTVTARLREWVERPTQLDPPYPVGTEAVQVLTVHQAKGLEFPVVVIWDGKGLWRTRPESGAWRMERDGSGWMMDLNGLTWEEPANLGIRQTEREYLDAERRRIIYIAATRTRDILIVPRAGVVASGQHVCGDLLADTPPGLTLEIPEYVEGNEPPWALQKVTGAEPIRADGTQVEREVMQSWAAAAAQAALPRFQPASVTGEAGAAPRDMKREEVEPEVRKPREGRFGRIFGSTVHHAIGLMLHKDNITVQQAVHWAARRYGLTEHLDQAHADVERAMQALRAEGLARIPSADMQLEYPIAGAWTGGQLLNGYIDLVYAPDGRLDVIDFKTDAPPTGPVQQTYPKYAAQVRLYGRLLTATDLFADRQLRCGLLFTADGGIRWVQP